MNLYHGLSVRVSPTSGRNWQGTVAVQIPGYQVQLTKIGTKKYMGKWGGKFS